MGQSILVGSVSNGVFTNVKEVMQLERVFDFLSVCLLVCFAK